MAIAYLNGEWMPPEKARVSVFDRGFLFGDAVYEVMAVYGKKIFMLDSHLARLNRGLKEIHLRSPHDDNIWSSLLSAAVERGGEDNGYLYLQVTRGVELPRSHVYSVKTEPTVLIMMTPLPEQNAKDPLRVVTKEDYRWQRADIKVTSLVANSMLRNEALSEGYDDAILIRDGLVTEATAANVFIVRDGVILTPPPSRLLLHGVTRDHVVGLARRSGLKLQEREITESELLTAEEAWITSTSEEMRPIIEINNTTVGSGSFGGFYQKVDLLFQESKTDP